MLRKVWKIMTSLLVLFVMDVVTQQNNLTSVRYGSNLYTLLFTQEMFVKFHACLCEGQNICYAKYKPTDLVHVNEIVYQWYPYTSNKNPIFYKCGHTANYPGMTCIPSGIPDTSEVANTTVFMLSKPVSQCVQRCVGLKWTYDNEGINFSADIQPFIQNCDINCTCPALTLSSPFSPASSSELSVTSSPELSVTSSPELSVTSSSATSSSGSSVAKTSKVSPESTTLFLTGRHALTNSHSYNAISTSASSQKPVEPTAHTSKAKDDDDKEAPVGIIVGAVAGIIVVAVIVIVIVVVWKRRNREPKASDYSTKTGTRSTSSGHTEEQNNKRTQGREPHYVNTTPSNKYQNTKVTNEHNVGNGSDNTILQQDDTDDNDDDFGYYTTHTISSGNHDGITNGTVSTKDTTETQPNRISDDYGYAYAEDQSSGDNVTKANKNGPSVVVAINQNINIKSSGDDYEDVYTGDEIPSTDTKARGKNLEERDASPSKIPPMKTKEPEEEYAVVNKSQSVAKGDTTSESKDVYSKLHETERHITNPYDSLHHLNASSNAENLPDSTHKLHSANQSSPYELARPIPGTSANENGRATEDFELVPVASSTGRKESDAPNKDQQNVGLQGKKQAKKLPYGPEDYAVVIKSKPNNKNKAAGFELGNK